MATAEDNNGRTHVEEYLGWNIEYALSSAANAGTGEMAILVLLTATHKNTKALLKKSWFEKKGSQGASVKNLMHWIMKLKKDIDEVEEWESVWNLPISQK